MKAIKVVTVFLVAMCLFCTCGTAKEPLFLDGDPNYPLVYAAEGERHYLDISSCTLLSGDEDGFSFSLAVIETSENQAGERRHTLYFQKNEVTDGQLQVLPWSQKGWQRILDPSDIAAVAKILDAKGNAYFFLREYYVFRLAYRHILGKPYEDGRDEDEVARSVLIGQRENKPGLHAYLWDDENYPCIGRFHTSAWHLDKSSVYAEAVDPPQSILRVLVFGAPQLHGNDILPSCVFSYRLLYDEDEGAMYRWLPGHEEWSCISPEGKNAGTDIALYAGEAAFYLAYGKRFYDVSPLWFHRRNPWLKEYDYAFYARLDGIGQ